MVAVSENINEDDENREEGVLLLDGRYDPSFLTREDEDEEMEDESGTRIEEGLSNWIGLWMAEC
jgi:hypothetical protein